MSHSKIWERRGGERAPKLSARGKSTKTRRGTAKGRGSSRKKCALLKGKARGETGKKQEKTKEIPVFSNSETGQRVPGVVKRIARLAPATLESQL